MKLVDHTKTEESDMVDLRPDCMFQSKLSQVQLPISYI